MKKTATYLPVTTGIKLCETTGLRDEGGITFEEKIDFNTQYYFTAGICGSVAIQTSKFKSRRKATLSKTQT